MVGLLTCRAIDGRASAFTAWLQLGSAPRKLPSLPHHSIEVHQKAQKRSSSSTLRQTFCSRHELLEDLCNVR